MNAKDLLPILAIATVLAVMYLAGWGSGQSSMRIKAVKANLAYWTVNERGTLEFHWITE